MAQETKEKREASPAEECNEARRAAWEAYREATQGPLSVLDAVCEAAEAAYEEATREQRAARDVAIEAADRKFQAKMARG